MQEAQSRIDEIIGDLKANTYVQRMKHYTQHGQTTTFRHCEQVAEASYRLNRALFLNADEEVLLTGAMLHDFFLYDWHEKDGGEHDGHGFIHAHRAAENARNYLGVNARVGHVIESHMWPLNITKIPRSKEAWIVCAADKYVALRETFSRR